MERLLPADPSQLGGHRLLGRLGAGGMGVVYLARTEAGELAAVKVIQPEFAGQAEFRARFRREAASAQSVDSPWVVRVLDADTEAAAPWLATAFVPGPSLAEAVPECGTLPPRVVRVLGKVLARALEAVHGTGLVHRDVKPGNVLLALDGPRLIDFGIAKDAGVTALTAHDAIVGTPGYLSPEQARARDTARGLLAQPSVLAVIGPTTITGAAAAVPLYCAASMPVVLVSVDSDAAGLSRARLRSLCVTRASDDTRTLPLVSYLTANRPSSRTAVVEDEAAGETARAVSRELSAVPPHQGTVTVHRTATDTGDFGPVVAQALSTRPNAVVYAGTSPERAAACARALAAAHFTGVKATIDPVMRPAFLTAAEDAAEGWVFGAPFTEPQSATSKAAKAFTSAYHARFGTAPGRWSAEAYDAVGLIARAVAALTPATVIEPGQVAERLFETTYDGVAKHISFPRNGTHLMDPPRTSFLYQVENGAFRYLGRYDQVR